MYQALFFVFFFPWVAKIHQNVKKTWGCNPYERFFFGMFLKKFTKKAGLGLGN
jgi:hypothetical protein